LTATSQAPAAESSASDGYAPPDERPPLREYAVLTAIFNTGIAGFFVAARRRKALPERIAPADIAEIGIASHKISRLIAKDRVTSFLRAPFRRLEGESGPNELDEETRGEGAQAAIGELIGCPYCLGLWVAAGLAAGTVFAPKETRFVTGVFSALTIADFMQVAYKAAQIHGLESG
jgi:hypothetical protein